MEKDIRERVMCDWAVKDEFKFAGRQEEGFKDEQKKE